METARMMVVHAIVIGLVFYLFSVFVLKHKTCVAEERSILLAALALTYMILFGHGLPTSINKNLYQ